MAFKLIYQFVLLASVSCQTQNSTGQFEAERTEPRYNLNQNSTDQISNETTPQPPKETVSSVGIDYTNNGKDESLADYFEKKIGQLIGMGTTDPEVVPSVPDEAELQNCSLPAVLDRYCDGVPQDVYAFFHYDLQVTGILALIFKPDVIGALQTNCTAGNWCLPDSFHQDIKLTKTQFYLDNPFCSDAMWTCLNNMRSKRIACGEKQLNFLVDTIFMMCELESFGVLTEECYARTKEALYVTYADMTHPNGSKSNLEQTECGEYKVQMTRIYLCADEVCSFDQNSLLEKFEPWVDLALKAADVAATCNISRSCQSEYDIDNNESPYSYGYYDYTGYDDDYSDDYDDESKTSDEESNELNKELEEFAGIEEGVDKSSPGEELDDSSSEDEKNEENENEQIGSKDEVNTDTNGGYDEHDRSMMLGLIVMTTVLLLGFVGLAFLVYRRFKRTRNGSYKWGYSKLANEDARVVTNDYK